MGAGETGKRARPSADGARAFSLAVFVAFVLVLLVFAALLSAAGARAYTPQPAGAAIEPNPSLEGNTTFSTYLAGSGPLTFPVGAGTQTLPGIVDPRLITGDVFIVPSGIVAPGVLSAEKINGLAWNATSYWTAGGGQHGATESAITQVTANAQIGVQFSLNTSAGGVQAGVDAYSAQIPVASWPSQNPAFDYVTAIFGMSGPSCPSSNACYTSLTVNNNTGAGQTSIACAYANESTTLPLGSSCTGANFAVQAAPGQTVFASESLSRLSASATAGFNVSGPGKTTSLGFSLSMWLPTHSTLSYTATLYGLAFTSTPLTLGNVQWGATKNGITPSYPGRIFVNSANLSVFSPSFTYTSVSGGAYTVAIMVRAQDMANVTVTTSAVNVANKTAGGPAYIEQGTYSVPFVLPIVAAVSYGAFKLVDNVSISGGQYVSVAYAGTSYTTAYQAFTQNKWYTVQSVVTPTTLASWVGIVQYTGAQWDMISTAPGIFSAGGLQYWWYILIGVLLSGVGLGGSAWATTNQRQLKIRRGGMVRLDFWNAPSYDWRGRRRRFIMNKRAIHGRHAAALAVGVIFIGAGAIGLWAFQSGADTNGIFGAFLAGLLLLVAFVAIVFAGYEIAHLAGKKKRGEHRL